MSNVWMQDAQFGDDSCLYFLYPIKGGTFHSVSKKIGKHLQSPVPSSDRVCIRSCGFGKLIVSARSGTLRCGADRFISAGQRR